MLKFLGLIWSYFNDEIIYEMNHILNCGYEINGPCSYERNFSNYIEKPEKFRISTGFEPVTSQYRCDALTLTLTLHLTDLT